MVQAAGLLLHSGIFFIQDLWVPPCYCSGGDCFVYDPYFARMECVLGSDHLVRANGHAEYESQGSGSERYVE